MNEKKYLVYVDILGFEDLLKDIGNERGIESRKVRNDFISVIEKGLEEIKQKGRIIEIIPYGGDSWILVTDALDKVFLSILEILDHNTGYKDYEKIPLEFGIGTGKFDKWAKFEGRHLTCEDETIKWLKTYIVSYYHDWYKQKHNNESPKSTFIVLTESAYRELEPLDKKICQKIEYKYKKDDGKEEVITFFIAGVDKVQQRGRVFEFLEKIGYAGNKGYGRIDEVYVPPLEYEDMAETLKERRFVFITGTPEYGKTFTAVRLMWEFYNRGYVPKWIPGGERAEREVVRRKLENISTELKPGHIVYFEDPFGKEKYERRESLEREIGTIIDSVQHVEDAYVIITSREEVFKEFEKEKISAKELKEFEEKLNVKKPSYDYEKRREMLHNWAEEENCKWLGNERLKEFVLESIEDDKILPTPLSIRDFAVASFDIEKEDELKEKIEEKSKETAKVFADEIKNMTDDKILFLSFPFISKYFKVEFVRVTYQELVKELNLEDALEFDRVLKWFKEDKINIIYRLRKVINKHIEFSHPSYSEALPYLLVEDGYITRINREIFSKLLLKLSEKDRAAIDVAWAVAHNFDKLPEDVRNELLLKLSEKNAAALAVVSAVSRNFDKLPDDVKNKLLFNLSEKDAAAWHVAWVVAHNFDKLPDDVRNLLGNLQKPLQQVIEDLSRSEEREEKETALFLISNALPKINPDLVSKILKELSECVDETVRIEAKKMLKDISDDSKGKKEC
ncbi:MAG: hypothetical protein WA977_08805 [Halobacteriota archaeon]